MPAGSYYIALDLLIFSKVLYVIVMPAEKSIWNANGPHRHGEDKLQDGQTQGRGIDESASCEHEVGEGSLAWVAHNIPLVTPLIIPTTSQDTISTDALTATLQGVDTWTL